MKYQVVKIGDRYAVRKKWFNGGRLIDLKCPEFSWDNCTSYYRDCFGTKEQAIEVAKLKSQENKRKDPKIVVVAEY